MVTNQKLSDEKLIEAIYKAADEYSKLIGNSYLIIGKNKKSDYFWFKCQFEKKHFMHLLGIDSKTLGATEFYDRCDMYNNGIGDGIEISDCSPSRNHNRTTLNQKSSCCAEMLQIQDAKYMKVGLKDKISQYVDFSYGYGNMATLGFKRWKETSFPITLIPRRIDEFVTKKYKIIFVLRKKIGEKIFKDILTEVKNGLFSEIYAEFPNELKQMCGVEHNRDIIIEKEISKAYWDKKHENYKRDSIQVDDWLDKFGEMIEATSLPIIDLGCGSGNDTLYLIHRNKDVIPCDQSSNAITCIRENFPEIDEAYCFDMLDGLPFSDEFCDIIIADLSLHYFRSDDTRKIIGEIYRILKPEGHLIFRVNSVNDVNFGAGRGREIERNLYQTSDGRLKRFFDEEDIKLFFNKFVIEYVQEKSMGRYRLEKKAYECCVKK